MTSLWEADMGVPIPKTRMVSAMFFVRGTDNRPYLSVSPNGEQTSTGYDRSLKFFYYPSST